MSYVFHLTDRSVPPMIFLGGKGGVGKTTCALALGLQLAERGKTLVVSTDPAHSLADSLALETGAVLPEQFQWLELDAAAELARFKQRHEAEIRHLLDTSSYLEAEDIDALLDLGIPGLDEIMGFRKVIDVFESGDYQYIVVDTAPTGHSLRLLQVPQLLDEWVKVMAKMRWKYRYIQTAFKGRYDEDSTDDLLMQLKRLVVRTKKYLTDPAQCAFWIVARPESMVVAETIRLAQKLTDFGITIGQVLVNGVMQETEGAFCQAMRQGQQPYLDQLQQAFAKTPIAHLPLSPTEIRGADRLVGMLRV